MEAMTRTQAKAAAADRGIKYRITKNGEVHFYGTMPNTTTTGWYLAAWEKTRDAQEQKLREMMGDAK